MQEVWRLVGIANKNGTYGFAEVSNFGRVKDKYGKIKTQREDKDGYLRVSFTLKEKSVIKYIHRLVANAFVENTYDKPQVNHIDTNKKNNRVDNLEWVTSYENVQHAIKHGKNNPKGENNSNSKLKQFEVDEIRQKFSTNKYKVSNLAKEYNVSWSLIKQIVTNKIWK